MKPGRRLERFIKLLSWQLIDDDYATRESELLLWHHHQINNELIFSFFLCSLELFLHFIFHSSSISTVMSLFCLYVYIEYNQPINQPTNQYLSNSVHRQSSSQCSSSQNNRFAATSKFGQLQWRVFRCHVSIVIMVPVSVTEGWREGENIKKCSHQSLKQKKTFKNQLTNDGYQQDSDMKVGKQQKI